MLEQRNTLIADPFETYMSQTPDVEFNDVFIEDLSVQSLMKFANADGVLTKSFDAVVRNNGRFDELFIISSTAYYESDNGDIPAVQVRIIDEEGKTLYYSPVYEIGHPREYYRKEWRILPAFNRYSNLRLSFIIPEGVRLYLRDIRIKSNYGFRERDIGIRFHGHAGCTNVFGMQLTAEAGYTSCITIPKFTKDGIGVCMHDDETVIAELVFDDGSKAEAGGPLDKPISEFTYAELMQFSNAWRKKSDVFAGLRVPTMDEYFRICSMTGMQPIFSVHPALTTEQWRYVKELLVKYRLLEHFYVKSNQSVTHKRCLEVFDDSIGGYILIQGAKDSWDPKEKAESIGLDGKRHNLIMEYFNHLVTEEKIKTAKQEGFNVSVALMRGGASGPHIMRLIELGVTEFTLDHHCSMGLDW